MMVENSKNLKWVTFENHMQMIGWQHFQRLNRGSPSSLKSRHNNDTCQWLGERYQTMKSRDNFRKLVRLPVKSSELVSVFIEASRKVIFLTTNMQKIIKTIGASTESNDLIFKTFKKVFIS
jgi:hypothetical protein